MRNLEVVWLLLAVISCCGSRCTPCFLATTFLRRITEKRSQSYAILRNATRLFANVARSCKLCIGQVLMPRQHWENNVFGTEGYRFESYRACLDLRQMRPQMARNYSVPPPFSNRRNCGCNNWIAQDLLNSFLIAPFGFCDPAELLRPQVFY